MKHYLFAPFLLALQRSACGESYRQHHWLKNLQQLCKIFRRRGQIIPLLRQQLNRVLTILQQPTPNLEQALQTLQQIKQSSVKVMQFNIPQLGGNVTGSNCCFF